MLCRREGRAFLVNGWVAHEILMAVREAVYNAVLHGAPEHITVSTEFRAAEVLIQIADDGKGL